MECRKACRTKHSNNRQCWSDISDIKQELQKYQTISKTNHCECCMMIRAFMPDMDQSLNQSDESYDENWKCESQIAVVIRRDTGIFTALHDDKRIKRKYP